MNKKLWFLIIGIVSSFCIADTRDLVILLDWSTERIEDDLDNLDQEDSFKSFGALSIALTSAILQKVPILTTGTLLKNYLLRKQIFADFIQDDLSILNEKYLGKFKRFQTPEDIKKFAEYCKFQNTHKSNEIPYDYQIRLSSYFRSYKVPFEIHDWRVEKVNPYFYLFIPKDYIKNLKALSLKEVIVDLKSFQTKLTYAELLLGLKKQGELIEKMLDPNQIDTPLQLNIDNIFIKLLPSLFINFQDLADKDNDEEKTLRNQLKYLHEWFLILKGHGLPTTQEKKEGKIITKLGIISALRIPIFEKFLNFLNSKIETELLLYTSCFVGGTHLLKPYEKTWFYQPLASSGGAKKKEYASKIFNYAIVANGLQYAPSQSPIVYFPNFKSFFNEVESYFSNPVGKTESDLFKIINNVYPLYDKTGKLIAGQLPVIRYPGTEWFSIIHLNEKIFNLTRVLVETRQAEAREIAIINKELVIIYPEKISALGKSQVTHSEILVPVRIRAEKDKKFPVIISTANAPAKHYFDQILAQENGFTEVLNAFFAVPEHYGRTFYINKLSVKNDIIDNSQSKMLGMVQGQLIDLYNVRIFVNDRNPLNLKDTGRYDGFIFSTIKSGKNTFISYFPAKRQGGMVRVLSANILPDLEKTEKKLPKYPFKLPEAKLKEIAEMLKKRKEIEKLTEQPKSEKEEIPVSKQEVD